MPPPPFNLHPSRRQIDPSVFVADSATVVGDVTIGQQSSVWFAAVLRGDLAPIRIGANCSIQDGAVVHVDQDMPTTIGNRVTIGHGAVVHGCDIADDVLIGIRAVVLSRARIGANSVIGACALITEDMDIPPRSLVVGVPGKVVRTVSAEQDDLLRYMWEEYLALSRAYKQHRPDLDRLS